MPNIKLGDFCCQGKNRIIDSRDFRDSDLILAQGRDNTLMFSPLGNKPREPTLALIGVTPGSQSEAFAKMLRTHPIEVAASKAAFAKGQNAIKALLRAHGFAEHAGLDLHGDLNENPKILTSSLVKCCLKVGGSYKYKAPDISASPEATYCVKNRFVSDIEQYPTLKWVVIFGDAGWEAVMTIETQGLSIRAYLESKGLAVLNYPHFAQNFQQRAIFALRYEQEEIYFADNPSHLKYAPTARRMRQSVVELLEGA